MFKIGDQVEWSSQAQGSETTKQGRIVAVVSAGDRPNRDNFEDLYKGPGCGFGRDHESYVVRVVAGKTGNAKPKHYWPRVSALRPA